MESNFIAVRGQKLTAIKKSMGVVGEYYTFTMLNYERHKHQLRSAALTVRFKTTSHVLAVDRNRNTPQRTNH